MHVYICSSLLVIKTVFKAAQTIIKTPFIWFMCVDDKTFD